MVADTEDNWLAAFQHAQQWLEVQQTRRPAGLEEVQAEAVCDLLGLEAGARVLAVPSGDGGISLELAAAGMQVKAMDVSAPVLLDLRRRAQEQGLKLEIERRDARELAQQAAFDAVLCMYGSFGMFGEAEDQRFAVSMAQALVPGGRCLVDAQTTETLFPRFQVKRWASDAEPIVLEEHRWDPAEGVMHTRWTIAQRGAEPVVREGALRIYSARELAAMFRQAGFDDVELYGDLSGSQLAIGSAAAVVVGRR